MAFTCGFFNSQNGDRKYNAEQMASIFDGLIKDGVYDTVGDIFAVTPGTGMQVLVGSGRAWFDHTWNNNDAQYPLAITAADVSLPRYDAVVLETNHSDTVRTNRLRVLTGTPASNPAKPTMASSANVKQHPLAYIRVTAGAKAITQSMIQVVVGTSECPFVTGIIDTAQIDALFQQWNGEFNEWFDNLKAQLSDNVVANLQGQIDQKVAKADAATTADIEAGTSTTKWVTPKGLKESVKSNGIYDETTGKYVKLHSQRTIKLVPFSTDKFSSTTVHQCYSSNNLFGFITSKLRIPSGTVYRDPVLYLYDAHTKKFIKEVSAHLIGDYQDFSLLNSFAPRSSNHLIHCCTLQNGNSRYYFAYRIDTGGVYHSWQELYGITKNYAVVDSNGLFAVYDNMFTYLKITLNKPSSSMVFIGSSYTKDEFYFLTYNWSSSNGSTLRIYKYTPPSTDSTLVGTYTFPAMLGERGSIYQVGYDDNYIYLHIYNDSYGQYVPTKILKINNNNWTSNAAEVNDSIGTDTSFRVQHNYNLGMVNNSRIFITGSGSSSLFRSIMYFDISDCTIHKTSFEIISNLGDKGYRMELVNFTDWLPILGDCINGNTFEKYEIIRSGFYNHLVASIICPDGYANDPATLYGNNPSIISIPLFYQSSGGSTSVNMDDKHLIEFSDVKGVDYLE